MQPNMSIVEELAASIMQAEADDVESLARMHDKFAELARANDGVQEIELLVERAQKQLESVILRDAEDSAAVLRDVTRLVTDLQARAQHGGFDSAVTSTHQTEAIKQAAEPAHPALPDSEPPPSGDDVQLAQDFISEATGHIESAEAALLVIEETPGDIDAINSVFRSFHTVKGVAGFLNLKQIGSLAHAAENLLDLARHGKLDIVGPTADAILDAVDLLKTLIAALQDSMQRNVPQPLNPKLGGMLSRLAAAASGTPVAAVQAEAVAPAQPAPQVAEHDTQAAQSAPAADAPKSSPEQGAPAATSRGGNAEATVKVSTERLDSLINMVGELVIAQSMVSQDMMAAVLADQKLARNLTHLGKITRELRDLSMSMRMVPIQGVFQKMARIVRDLSKKSGKDIEFVTVGGETELDRNLVEAISDPLVHMIRNSADHGIETPEKRLQSGKSGTGRVELRASHQGGSIAIQITDDGNGLPKSRILKKAIEAGVVRKDQELSEQEIFKLIFHPGLSTAEKITDVSGRGVGMDVVKRNVEALRGRIDIASAEGKGTTFTIRLPLTLAVIDGLVVKVGAQRYIIPITSVEQTIQPKTSQLSTVQGRGEMCMVRGKLLPLYRLCRVFNVKQSSTDPTTALVLILQDGERRCCLMVDQLIGQAQVVIKSLGDSLGQVRGVAGAAILGDGSACLIVDVAGVMDLACSAGQSPKTTVEEGSSSEQHND